MSAGSIASGGSTGDSGTGSSPESQATAVPSRIGVQFTGGSVNLQVYPTADHVLIRKVTSNSRVSQIAYDLGFEYPQHFSKIFKRKTGMTPSEYRGVN